MTISAKVLSHPKKIIDFRNSEIDECLNITYNKNELPSNILVLRIEFPNLKFDKTVRFGVEYPHDDIYFNKYMNHLQDYYHDSSKGNYTFNYYLAETIYIAPHNVEAYAPWEDRNVMFLIRDLIAEADADSINPINFSLYDGYIVFRAGGGRESDIEDANAHRSMSSRLISLGSLKEVLDPENDNYQGIETSSGVFVSRLAFVPESQYHPYMDRDNIDVQFDILGVLCNLFGRMIGIPTLSGNVRPTTAGAGNFCLMGTGFWNNNGMIPPLLSAWVRFYMGWEEAVEITVTTEDLRIGYPQSKTDVNKMYKIPISNKEYFLIENRQQNFVKDFAPNGVPLFSFSWDIPDQDSLYIEGGGYYIKMPNTMKNSLKGCEWDYFTPFIDYKTYNQPVYQEGSGLLIWHIDENIIFKETIINGTTYTNIERNIINGDPRHRGVRLEEADGIFHLNSTALDLYMRGSPFDSFREGNNSYFGKQINPDTGFFSLPTANSYYGGINSEIYNISSSDTVMTFSVRFEHFYDTEREEKSSLEIFISDINKIIYFHANGDLSVFSGDNKNTLSVFPPPDTMIYNYTFDGKTNLVFPIQDFRNSTRARLIKLDGDELYTVWSQLNEYWAGSVIYIEDEMIIEGKFIKWIAYTNSSIVDKESKVYLLDEDFDTVEEIVFEGTIVSNISYRNNQIMFLLSEQQEDEMKVEYIDIPYYIQNKQTQQGTSHTLQKKVNTFYFYEVVEHLQNQTYKIYQVNFDTNGLVFAFITSKNTSSASDFYYKVYVPFGEETHWFNQTQPGSIVLEKYSIAFPYRLVGQPTFKDVSGNGKADIILAHSNGFKVFTIQGTELYNIIIDNPDFNDNSGTGVIAWDWANDGNLYYIGGFSRNRLMFFDNNFQLIKNMTKILPHPIKILPFVHNARPSQTSTNNGISAIHQRNNFLLNDISSNIILYQPTDQGRIYHVSLPNAVSKDNLYWEQAEGNYFRNAFWKDNLHNRFFTHNVFVKNECFVYPNPWIKRYHKDLKFNIMTSIPQEVEIKIYNIAGQQVAQKNNMTEAYVIDNTKFVFDPDRWASGIYFAVIKAQNNSFNIKFAIER